MKLGDLAKQLSCVLEGDGNVEIVGVATLESASKGDLSFFTNRKYHAAAKTTRASAIITGLDCAQLEKPLLRHSNPYLTFARALEIFCPSSSPRPVVHPTAWVDDSARIGEGVSIGAFTFIGEGVTIGNGSVVGAHCVVESGAEIGEHCLIHSGCVVRERVRIGRRCVLQNNAVVGSDGFGYARTDEGEWYRVRQTGIVVLEDEVDVGACSTIDRATLGETRIRRGTKIDNLVHVGHGCEIGPDNLICAQAGLAGSTSTGSKVILAGQVGAAGHLQIGDGVLATAQTGIPSSIESGRHISGSPAVDHKVWLKASAAYARSPELTKLVRALERRVAELESQHHGGK